MGAERRAFRMAQLAVRNTDDALDIVQDSMLKLARKYGDRSEAEWGPLFFTILSSRIMDFHRRKSVRNRWFGWALTSREGVSEDEQADSLAQVPAESSAEPEQRAQLDGASAELLAALERLPVRQQQAFLLRAVEGLDVAATAAAMGCSDGSVKTHYSRAVHSLRSALGEHW